MYKNAAQVWLPIIMASTAALEDLSDWKKGDCWVCLAGASVTKTAQLADFSWATVSKVISAWNSDWKISTANGNSVWKSIFQDHDICALIWCARQSSRATTEQLTVSFNLGREQPFSSKTVCRELHQAGYHSWVAMHKLLITPGSAHLWIQWCKEHRHWSTEQWRNVI